MGLGIGRRQTAKKIGFNTEVLECLQLDPSMMLVAPNFSVQVTAITEIALGSLHSAPLSDLLVITSATEWT